jgi:prepilin-type N-terminal cleavage/methylation domain-containing protein
MRNIFKKETDNFHLSGFTLIELLISMAILIIVASTSFVYLGGYRRTANIDSALQKIVSFTREAQMRAKNGQDGVAWGVHWENPSSGEDFYALFKDAYISATSAIEIIKLGNAVEFTDPIVGNYDEVIFQRVTGNPVASSTTIAISSKISGALTKTITINSLGQMIIASASDPNLVAYWKFDEGTGSTTADSATSHGGVITGATWQTESNCKSNNCLYFDGSDRVVISPFSLSGTVLTVSGWVKIANNATVRQTIMGEANVSATVGYIFLYRNSGQDDLLWRYADGSSTAAYVRTTTFFTGYDNTWVHFAVVADYSGKTVKFYRNGTLIQTSTMAGTPVFPSTNRVKYLGDYSAGAYPIIGGSLDDIRIYNKELSGDEIKAIYEETK